MARRYRIVSAIVGVGLVAYLLYATGLDPVVASFRALSWRLALLCLFPAICLKLSDVFAWRCVLPRGDVPFTRLLGALLAGQAVSASTPTGPFGGDAVKVWMLRDRVARRDNLASLIIMETTSTASQGLFLLIGIAVARQTLSLSTPLLQAMEWLLVLEALAVAAFIALQLAGALGRGHGLLARLGFAGGAGRGAAAAHVDEALAAFYRGEPRRFTRALAWGLLGWFLGGLEVFLMLRGLGTPVSPGTSLVIEGFGTGISFATFFLPVQIGVDEGGAVATFLALGLNPGTGLALSLVRRVREVTWIAIGFLLLASPPRPAPVASATAGD